MKSILFAVLVIMGCMAFIEHDSVSGRDELKAALKNYSVITR